jgi:uncharacterized protein YceH (UPF0502 family)
MQTLPPLSLIETRVLGVLFEKQRTVPDTYPLSLNALVAGCNQKNNRAPVIEATDAEVQGALDSLRSHSLVIESSGSRVTRYEHNLTRVLQVPEQSAALLAALMLRGPQTPAELRVACERLHRFADSSAVEAFLAELAARESGALVAQLPRQHGEREQRWTHLLSGMPAPDTFMNIAAGRAAPGTAIGELQDRVTRLEAEVAGLRAELAALRADGHARPGAP